MKNTKKDKKIIIEVDGISYKNKVISSIQFSLYKNSYKIKCILKKKLDCSFVFTAINSFLIENIEVGSKSIVLNNFPSFYGEAHYYNRTIIKWIADHSDDIIKKIK